MTQAERFAEAVGTCSGFYPGDLPDIEAQHFAQTILGQDVKVEILLDMPIIHGIMRLTFQDGSESYAEFSDFNLHNTPGFLIWYDRHPDWDLLRKTLQSWSNHILIPALERLQELANESRGA